MGTCAARYSGIGSPSGVMTRAVRVRRSVAGIAGHPLLASLICRVDPTVKGTQIPDPTQAASLYSQTNVRSLATHDVDARSSREAPRDA